MQECTKRNVSTETKLKFHVFQDERFVDLNLYQYGWEQTEPLHSYGPYARNRSILTGRLPATTICSTMSSPAKGFCLQTIRNTPSRAGRVF